MGTAYFNVLGSLVLHKRKKSLMRHYNKMVNLPYLAYFFKLLCMKTLQVVGSGSVDVNPDIMHLDLPFLDGHYKCSLCSCWTCRQYKH